ncbi:MAG: hypothetical protein A2070_03140 [Bdellovibrionales bacterium GWC1_52_8]|nr:MAG: hypothetical protein A2Z97_04630 [Bdellovibrionales bacterium GWB1_52_6]OFZ05543.1 MAG: hypothetical protein A2X97_11775 [Bdellovibrionales bacterium GWA1_52_35]OFZ33032.1 MAG: hypothetical protein A2070_03140 [Bdellovibrionales bacterium GWC1_52_8]HCM39088.1 stilbene synthase [Bdellovibrionales bacterium]
MFSITDFRILRPEYSIDQAQSLEWIAAAHSKTSMNIDYERRLLRRLGCSPSNIAHRGHDLPDYADGAERLLFDTAAAPTGHGLEVRLRFFEKKAEEYFNRFYEGDSNSPQYLFHVTCTGYVSPSAAQTLVSKRGWGRSCQVTHLYHMGCSAAIPAIRIAGNHVSAAPREMSRADIVHTELCSLHFNPTLHAPEQYVVQSLFADGAIRYSVLPGTHRGRNPGLRVKALLEWLTPDSLNAMSWRLSDISFVMGLSAEVPGLIASQLETYLEALFEKVQLDYSTEKPRALFLIHPGGPKILDFVEKELALTPTQLRHSRQVLQNYGNMSSATLPHIWAAVCGDAGIAAGTQLISIAFGPGLTIAGALLEKES